jgi:phosphatidylserine decarboxylase
LSVVNPQAVNEVNFDVFTANVREILYIKHAATGKKIAFVAVGAMLVGAVRWTAGQKDGHVVIASGEVKGEGEHGGSKLTGTKVKRGDELGYFAYGGSTVIALWPKGTIE